MRRRQFFFLIFFFFFWTVCSEDELAVTAPLPTPPPTDRPLRNPEQNELDLANYTPEPPTLSRPLAFFANPAVGAAVAPRRPGSPTRDDLFRVIIRRLADFLRFLSDD
jgi:hypothetical protein